MVVGKILSPGQPLASHGHGGSGFWLETRKKTLGDTRPGCSLIAFFNVSVFSDVPSSFNDVLQ